MAGNVNSRVVPVVSEILQGSGKVTLDGRDVGSYAGGVKLEYVQTEQWVESEHALGPVDSEIQGVRVRVSTELEQATLENVATGWGIASSSVLSGTSSKTLELTPPSEMQEAALVFEGMSGTNRQLIRTCTFYKVVRIGTSATTFNRGVKTTVPVTFECLLNSSGSFGNIKDATV